VPSGEFLFVEKIIISPLGDIAGCPVKYGSANSGIGVGLLQVLRSKFVFCILI
jgi:hypothetical protein